MSERASERERGRRREVTHAENHWAIGLIPTWRGHDRLRQGREMFACHWQGLFLGHFALDSRYPRLTLSAKFPRPPKVKSAGERRFSDFTRRECKARTHASIGTTLRMTPEVGGIGYRRYLTEIKYASSLLGWSIFTRSIELLIIIQFYLAPQVREGMSGLWRSFLN